MRVGKRGESVSVVGVSQVDFKFEADMIDATVDVFTPPSTMTFIRYYVAHTTNMK